MNDKKLNRKDTILVIVFLILCTIIKVSLVVKDSELDNKSVRKIVKDNYDKILNIIISLNNSEDNVNNKISDYLGSINTNFTDIGIDKFKNIYSNSIIKNYIDRCEIEYHKIIHSQQIIKYKIKCSSQIYQIELKMVDSKWLINKIE